MLYAKQKLLWVSSVLLAISSLIWGSSLAHPPVHTAQAHPHLLVANGISKPLPMVSLLAGGDIMLSRNIGYYNKREGYDRIFGSGSYHPLSAFPNCNPQHCLLFFNLESPFHPKDNDIQKGGFTFRANVKNIQVLKDLQTPQRLPLILSLANNHLNNGGYQGVKTTRELLLQHDILPVGAGLTQAEAGFRSVVLQGMKLCFAAYSYDGKIDLQAGGGKFSRNPLNPDQIVTDIQAMEKS